MKVAGGLTDQTPQESLKQIHEAAVSPADPVVRRPPVADDPPMPFTGKVAEKRGRTPNLIGISSIWFGVRPLFSALFSADGRRARRSARLPLVRDSYAVRPERKADDDSTAL